MARSSFRIALFYFFIFVNGVLSLANVIVRDSELDETLQLGRRLRAARRRDGLGAREVKSCLKYDHSLHYVDGKRGHSG